MKRQVQKTGIRQWYGDDLIDIQNETMTAMEAFYQPYGSCVIKGCNITGKNISEGIVYLDRKIMRFLGGSVTSFPIYLKSNLRKETREYDAGGVKDVAEIYEAVISTSVPSGEYITINEHGGKSFRQAFQDANHRMVTDAMINNWNATEARAASDATSKANSAQTSAINTLRGSVTNDKNTLGKLHSWASGELGQKASIAQLNSELANKRSVIQLAGRLDYCFLAIALCKVPEGSVDQFAIGDIMTWRDNHLLTPPIIANVTLGKYYSGTIARGSLKVFGGGGFELVTFDYNGEKYAGIRVFQGAPAYTLVYWSGLSSITPFAINYKKENGTVLNAEISNSITTSNIYADNTFTINNKNVICETDYLRVNSGKLEVKSLKVIP